MYIDVELSDELLNLLVLLCESIHRFSGLAKKLLKALIVLELLLFAESVQAHLAIVVERSQLLFYEGLDFHQPVLCLQLHQVMNEVHGLEVTQGRHACTIHIKEPLVIFLFVFHFNHHLDIIKLNLTLLAFFEDPGGRLCPDWDICF